MEVLERHARTRAITRDTLSPANQPVRTDLHASRGVARVVSDVSVLCPRAVDGADNSSVALVNLKGACSPLQALVLRLRFARRGTFGERPVQDGQRSEERRVGKEC